MLSIHACNQMARKNHLLEMVHLESTIISIFWSPTKSIDVYDMLLIKINTPRKNAIICCL